MGEGQGSEQGEGEAVGEDEVQEEQDEVGTFSTRNIGVQVAVLEQGVVVEGLGAGVGAGVVLQSSVCFNADVVLQGDVTELST